MIKGFGDFFGDKIMKIEERFMPNNVKDHAIERHEEIEYQPITKDNIVEVLEHNGFQYIVVNKYSIKYKKEDHTFYVALKEHEHLGYGYLQNEEDYYNCPQIIHPNLSKVLDFMSEFCPLELLPKFDFVQYLLDNGFKVWGIDDYIEWSADLNGIRAWSEANAIFTNGGLRIKPTKDNADILIKMAELAKELS